MLLSRTSLGLTSLAALTFGFAIACGSSIPPSDDSSAASTTPASSSSATSSTGGATSKPVETSSGFPEDDAKDKDKNKDAGTSSSGATTSSSGGGDGGTGGGTHIVPTNPAKDCMAGYSIEAEPNDTTAQAITAATNGKTMTYALCGAAKTGDTDVFTFKLPDTASNISTKVKWTVGSASQVVIKVSAKADGADGDGHVEDGTLQSPPFIRGGTYTVTVTSATSSANTYNFAFATDTL